MTIAVAIQPAMPRPSPVPIAAARPRTKPQPMADKDAAQTQAKPLPSATAPARTNNFRSRRERPCDACRRRKSRCEIKEGADRCALCEFNSLQCTFVENPQPRKRKINNDPKKDEKLKKRFGESDAHLVLAKPDQSHSLPSPARSPVISDRKTKFPVFGISRTQHSLHVGPTADVDPFLIKLIRSSNEAEFQNGSLRYVSDNETFITMADNDNDPSELERLEELVHPHGLDLIHLYFRVVHPSFPIIHKSLFLEKYVDPKREDRPPASLVASIYLLALNWWSHDAKLVKHQRPNLVEIENFARASLTKAMSQSKLSTVQAGLLILQRPGLDSWSLTTQLVAIGQEQGLHRDCSTWKKVPEYEVPLRKRIAWALYMQDKWSSMINGRPSHILDENWAAPTLCDSDFQDQDPAKETEQERIDRESGQLLFSKMIELTHMMAEIMNALFTQIAERDFAQAKENALRKVLNRANSVGVRLTKWYHNLPKELAMDARTDKALCSTGFLHLAYFATSIILHRRVLHHLDSNATDSKEVSLRSLCRTNAKKMLIHAMDFVNRLQPHHLQAFWYFPSRVNFSYIGTFGYLLWATAPYQEEAQFYEMRLREYKWTLSVSMRKADFLDYAVNQLEDWRKYLVDIPEKPTFAKLDATVTGEFKRKAAKSGMAPPQRQQLQQQHQDQTEEYHEPEMQFQQNWESRDQFPQAWQATEHTNHPLHEQSRGSIDLEMRGMDDVPTLSRYPSASSFSAERYTPDTSEAGSAARDAMVLPDTPVSGS